MIKPLGDRILVKRAEAMDKTPGGIIIPTNDEKPLEGTVEALGQGVRLRDGTLVPFDLKVGDKVLFGKYAGNEIKANGETFLIIKEEEILGILEN